MTDRLRLGLKNRRSASADHSDWATTGARGQKNALQEQQKDAVAKVKMYLYLIV